MNRKYDSNIARERQKEYCEKNKAPHFAPERGVCWSCNRNIYNPVFWKNEGWKSIEVSFESDEANYITGVTIEKATNQLITGCPHCNRSYCS